MVRWYTGLLDLKNKKVNVLIKTSDRTFQELRLFGFRVYTCLTTFNLIYKTDGEILTYLKSKRKVDFS